VRNKELVFPDRAFEGLAGVALRLQKVPVIEEQATGSWEPQVPSKNLGLKKPVNPFIIAKEA
jgi:hypothetical protein